MRHALTLTVIVLILGGCAPVVGAHLANTDPGPYPSNYKQLIAGYLLATLKDPSSAQILSSSEPKPAQTYAGVQRGGNVAVWKSCITYNAKNSFGAYTGMHSYTFSFRDGQLFTDS